MTRTRTTALAATLLALGLLPGLARADYDIKDNDTVVFFGDSITAARTYGKIIENYTLLRFPDRKVRFINSGWGGDTAERGLKRLEADVFAHGATVLIVAFGINDIGWGTKADAEHEALFLDSTRSIIEACKARGVRVYICSAAVTATDPDQSEKGFLQLMCDKAMAMSREMGERSIDVQRTMRNIQRQVRSVADQTREVKDKPSLHMHDGVHLNDLGQLAMAFAILKGLGAPADVSSVTVDATRQEVVASQGCRVSNVKSGARILEFDRLDEGLPINFGTFGALQFRFIPVPEQLNRYMLTVHGLPEGRYEIKVDDRPLGTYPTDQLEAGVNIASATADGWEPGGPWDAQASLLIRLTDSRSEIAQARLMTGRYLPSYPEREAIRKQYDDADARIVTLQRTLTRPRPFHFSIRPADPKAKN
ncbi:GDSL-type esterase/lipase family protein [Singulisphaera sp. PoT]|uniref:GDSL-type esterase/lipase family protein n=1 Tax=Singulisphaera sp. PoT TaxID=3411797 RepID=UPI003BF4F267